MNSHVKNTITAICCCRQPQAGVRAKRSWHACHMWAHRLRQKACLDRHGCMMATFELHTTHWWDWHVQLAETRKLAIRAAQDYTKV